MNTLLKQACEAYEADLIKRANSWSGWDAAPDSNPKPLRTNSLHPNTLEESKNERNPETSV